MVSVRFTRGERRNKPFAIRQAAEGKMRQLSPCTLLSAFARFHRARAKQPSLGDQPRLGTRKVVCNYGTETLMLAVVGATTVSVCRPNESTALVPFFCEVNTSPLPRTVIKL
jgi:hypothetical protein